MNHSADANRDVQASRTIVVGLDVLRMAAALMVVAYHFLYASWTDRIGIAGVRDAIGADIAFPGLVAWSWWGWIGVQLFFVISGFVIAMSSAGRTALSFAVGRFSRLFPGLLVFSTLALAVVLGTGMLPPQEAAAAWLRAVLLVPKGPWIEGVIWTLTVEVIFYALVWLVLALGLQRRMQLLTRIAVVMLAMFWLIVGLQGAGFDLGRVGAALHQLSGRYVARPLLLTTGSYFLVGMLGFEIWSRGPSRARLEWLLLAVITSVLAIHAEALTSPVVAAQGRSPLLPVIIWLSCCGLAAISLVIERRWPANPHFRKAAHRAGLLTYPLYLVHYIVGGWILGRLAGFGIAPGAAVLLAVIACLAIAQGFILWIEPLLRRRLGIDALVRFARQKLPRHTVGAL